MSLAEFKSVALPKLGGLFTFLKPVDVPTGYSPNLQNVRFLPRAVLSRPGLTTRMSKANESFNGIAQFLPDNADSLVTLLINTMNVTPNVGYHDIVITFTDSQIIVPVNTVVQVAIPGNANLTHVVLASQAGEIAIHEPAATDGLYSDTGVVTYTQGNKQLVSLDSDGNIDFQDPSTGLPASLMVGATRPGALMDSHEAFGRLFMSFYNSDLSPAGPIRYWDGQRQRTCPVAGTSLAVATSLTVDANWLADHYGFAVLFEYTDGSLSLAAQDVQWTAPGGFAPTLTGIPLGAAGSNVVARWITITPGVGNSFGRMRMPQWKLQNNTATSLTLPSIGNGSTDALTNAGSYAGNAVIMDGINSSTTPTPPPLPHLSPEGPAGAPTAADSANAGSIALGVHQVWVVFENQFGYLSAPSPAGSWTAAGGKKGLISKIPIGPWYVKARRLLFSSSGLTNAFYVSTFRIPDNVSTAVEVDFTDTNLLQGSNVDYLFTNFAAPNAMASAVYGGRLAYWGAKNTVKVPNLGFDGGFDLTTGAPLGWVPNAPNFPGGMKEEIVSYAGAAWRMRAFGGGAIVGMIENHNVAPFLQANTPYSISFRAKRSSSPSTPLGAIQIEWFSPTVGVLGRITVPMTQVTLDWDEYSANITTGLTQVPSDMYMKLLYQTYKGQAPGPNGMMAWVDQMEIYPSHQDTETSILRLSNPFDPETFNSINGLISIAQNNGQQLTAVRQLRSFLYVMKERSMHVTYDDTVNPPALWTLRQIDSTIGCGSPRGLVSSDTFIAFSSRGGAYMFTGARPQKISQEIQTTWNAINWSLSGATHTLLDSQAKVIYFFLPLAGATSIQSALILDYSEGVGEEDDPGSRKWGRDLYPVTINAAVKFENSVVSQQLWGAIPNTGSVYMAGAKIYEHTGIDDDGVGIDWFYETAFLKGGEQGQDLFGGVVFYAEGGGPDAGGTSGQILVTLIGLDDVQQQGLLTANLTSSPGHQYEIYANMETERARIRFEQTVDGTFGILKGISVLSRPWAEQGIH